MSQRMILINSPCFITEDKLRAVGDWRDVFGNDRPLSLEIGCGTGHFVVERARRHPERNYLAIDIFNRGCYKTCRKVDESGLTNIRVVRAEARYLLAHFIAPGSLAEIFINCPDPWPKKRHRRRRLVNEDFFHLVRYALRPGGDFYFSSDFRDYAYEVATLLGDQADFACGGSAPITLDIEDYPRSKYMLRFLERGEPIYFVHFRHEPRAVRVATPPEVAPGFRLRWAEMAP